MSPFIVQQLIELIDTPHQARITMLFSYNFHTLKWIFFYRNKPSITEPAARSVHAEAARLNMAIRSVRRNNPSV